MKRVAKQSDRASKNGEKQLNAACQCEPNRGYNQRFICLAAMLAFWRGIARDDWIDRRAEVEPLLAGALALVGRWAERGLERRLPVSEIHIDAEYGTTLFAGDEGLEIRLGQGDLPDKLQRLERVLAAVAADGQRAEVLHLDNRRHPEWVAVRLAGRKVVDGPGSSAPR